MASSNHPNFFIVGAPKTGTSALTYFLSAHPDVFMGRKPGAQLAERGGRYAEAAVPLMKELNFFGRDLHRRFDPPTQSEYESYFSGRGDEAAVGDATVWYLYSRSASAEIRAFCGEARIVAMLRNPIDLMFSQFGQMRFRGYEPLEKFSAALAAESRRKGNGAPPYAPYAENYYYRDIVRFGPQLERYISEFGRGRVHVIFQEQFRESPESEYRRVCSFLNIDPDIHVPEFRAINKRKVARSDRIQDFLMRPPAAVKSLVKGLLPPPVRNRIWALLQAWNVKTVKRPTLDSSLRRRLVMELEEDIQHTEDVLGVDLRRWREA